MTTIHKNPEVLRAYAYDHPVCEVCFFGGNEIHHIIGGCARSDERCNLILLCVRCHRAVHDGGQYSLSKGQILYAKWLYSRGTWDQERLLELHEHKTGQVRLPEFEPLPNWTYSVPPQQGG